VAEHPLVRLRPMVLEDVDALIRMYNDPAAATEANWFGFQPGRAQRQLDRIATGATIDDEHGSLAATDADGELVAEVSWHQTDNSTPPNGRCWNIGIYVLPEHRGRGYGAAAQRALVEYLFEHTPVMRIEAGTEAGNPAEQRALEKAGFTREGVLRRAVFRGGAYRDMVIFSILRDEL
jgi:RimJ/RimL family protein N-acetyltransferase